MIKIRIFEYENLDDREKLKKKFGNEFREFRKKL